LTEVIIAAQMAGPNRLDLPLVLVAAVRSITTTCRCLPAGRRHSGQSRPLGWLEAMITRPAPTAGYVAGLHKNEGGVKVVADLTAYHHTEP
jgi:hypothetical protein